MIDLISALIFHCLPPLWNIHHLRKNRTKSKDAK